MLSAADLADFDLSGLSSGLQNLVVRHDRYRREAASIGVQPDCPETYNLIQAAKRDAEVLADAERLVALVRQFTADESTSRPAATSPNAQGLMARALAAISGVPSIPQKDRADG